MRAMGVVIVARDYLKSHGRVRDVMTRNVITVEERQAPRIATENTPGGCRR